MLANKHTHTHIHMETSSDPLEITCACLLSTPFLYNYMPTLTERKGFHFLASQILIKTLIEFHSTVPIIMQAYLKLHMVSRFKFSKQTLKQYENKNLQKH